ncbi:mannitol-1-phosphate 5-dehydrogenase [Pullulanibacillus pueri]|uniref:Mannitol-1-phosphate 5-dehydrogenase n=1 Tax=Pullulanibacillus pueri TaxID=1437324 RepID=A0A8J2ZY28_9BACL|nr:mannitol-1-phosphate 5-dehydrogenase [Pullulanibacillus pueri]MBM7682927.1 mannitol-1-phosphate 5-dehydrogenase [Pullulanibacillus pueri]GGH84764.1 mannitol-1-phosphate 5-dehydrogenase [Pullulanibacillus pueri]
MLAVHFGAGNIGRGFIGNLLYHSGYRTCFVDVNAEIVDLINEKQQYRVVLADDSQEENIIKDVTAINSQTDPEKVVDAIVKADLVTAAVGPTILPLISGLISEGLKKRLSENNEPLNIIACENMIGGSTLLKEKVYEKITDEEKQAFDRQYGFPDAAVDRIVPNQKNEDKLMVKVEPFYEWAVDQSKIVGEKPPVKGITYVDDLNPYIERKLFTVNTGHAITAYLGYFSGIKTIDEAMKNEKIRMLVEQALEETGAVLIEKYGFKPEVHKAYIHKILARFTNAHISDEVTRVGRSPIRKLGPNDRLISPAKQYQERVGKEPAFLAKGIAAALLFDYEKDEEAVELQESIKNEGLEATITRYTKLDKDSDLTQLIVDKYHSLKEDLLM